MPEIDLSKLYENMQKEMIQKLNTGAEAFVHPGTKGDDTELNWIEWFREYLPQRYQVDKAIIIDSTGKQSDQIDLVIYDAQYSYLVFKHGNEKLIPAESVYAVFEVKQNLNKDRIEYAGKKAKSVRALSRTSAPIKHAGGQYKPKILHEILAGILTTKSDWRAPIENSVVKYINEREKEERLDFVCSISNNTFVIDNNTFVTEYKESIKPKIHCCEAEKSLVYLLLNLLKKLQDIATVPAIDFLKYAEKINSLQLDTDVYDGEREP